MIELWSVLYQRFLEEVLTCRAENILFIWAVELSQQAAVEEIASVTAISGKMSSSTLKLYKNSYRIFELLYLQSQNNNDKFDQKILSQCMIKIKKRIENVSF